jgi:hypothetical protein
LKCANCGEELAFGETGLTHRNGVVFCAFAVTPINWNDWRTAKRPEKENDQTALSPGD